MKNVHAPASPGVVRGERVVTAQGLRPASLHLAGGRIMRVSDIDDVGGASAVEILDAGTHLVVPGLVDTHVHINEPGRTEWEGFETATRAALAGGVTTLLDMPLNSMPSTTKAPSLDKKRHSAEGQCWVDVGFLGGVVPGNVGELHQLWMDGVFGFKCFLVPSGVDEFRNVSEKDLRQAMPMLAQLRAPLLVHAELPEPILAATREVKADRLDPRLYSSYLASRPPAAEVEAVQLILDLARQYFVRVHIVHVASAEIVRMIREARADRVPVTAETCPHYLALEAEQIPEGATEFKCAPPIRSAANREGLWRGLQDGHLDFIVSDHSPCPPELKKREKGDFFAAWGGIASLELGLSVVWTEMQRRGIPPERLARWMCEAPARLAGLRRVKGRLTTGLQADFAVVDLDESYTVDADRMFQRHHLTPYAGKSLRGRVKATYIRGRLAYANGEIMGRPAGRLLKREGVQ